MSFETSQDLQGANMTKLICYLIVGAMLLLTIQALGELAVVYPQNGAFFTYCVRFINPAWLVIALFPLLFRLLAMSC